MKRRDFVKELGVGVSAVVGGSMIVSGCTDSKESDTPRMSKAKTTRTLKMVTSWPKNFPGLGTAARRFGERLQAASNGRYKVKLYAGGELVHPLKCHDAVQQGTAELYHSGEYYYKGKSMAFAFFTSVPFGLTAPEMNAWIHHGGGQELWDELSAQFGIKCFPCTNTGVQMGGWFKKPIKSLDDLKGLKMRIPGMGGDVLNALGGTSVTLGGAEIMPALQAGTIDATEWVGPWNDLAFGFYKVVKNYMWPGFHEPGSMLSLGINKKFWDGLSNGDQELFKACALAENNYGYGEFLANNGEALETLLSKHGVKIHEYPDDVFKAFGEASRDILLDASKKDTITKKVYDSFMRFRKKAIAWSKLSQGSYLRKRGLVKL